MARKRYHLIKIRGEKSSAITDEQFTFALITSIRKYFGEVGISTLDPRLIKYDVQSGTAIVACEKNHEEKLQAATALVKEINSTPVALLIVRASGTIKGLTKPLQHH